MELNNQHTVPQIYEVRGCGSVEANGKYQLSGIHAGRPYYTKQASTTSLWYFYSNVPFLSAFSGWYISKQAITSSASASDDYYSAYVHGMLPPTSGWVTRKPGWSPSAGCGHDPPPAAVQSVILNSSSIECIDCKVEQELLVNQSLGSSDILPRHIMVTNGGCSNSNGLYSFEGVSSGRPYYRRQAENAKETIWYFSNCPLSKTTGSMITYNGWYISLNLDTSSYSAGQDMYCIYNHSFSVPLDESPWIVREPGITPTAGCGQLPVPIVREATYIEVKEATRNKSETDVRISMIIFLLKVSLPNGTIITVPISAQDTIRDLKIHLDVQYNILRLYNMTLLLRNEELLDNNARVISLCKKGDLIVVNETVELPATITESIKRVVIIGGGPVGLWVCAHLKTWHPLWQIDCFEKREQYNRAHALRIDPVAFTDMMKWAPNVPAAAALEKLTEKWTPRTKTSIVESELRQLVNFLGVNLVHGQTVDVHSFVYSDKPPEFVICCDGAKSTARMDFINDINANPTLERQPQEFRAQKKLGSLLQVKFDAVGKVERSQGLVGTFLRNLPANREFFNILVGNFDGEKCITPITIFALINEQVESVAQQSDSTVDGDSHHSSDCDNSGRDSLTSSDQASGYDEMSQDSIDEHDDKNEQIKINTMMDDLNLVLQRLCPGGIKDLKVSTLPMEYKVASIVSHMMNGTPVMLVGDSAMGLPLEKGLNYGWRIASRLCRYVSFTNEAETVLKAYNEFFTQTSNEAISTVNNTYHQYLSDIKNGAIARSILKTFTMGFGKKSSNFN